MSRNSGAVVKVWALALAFGALALAGDIALADMDSVSHGFLAALQVDRPNVRWDQSTLVEGDFTGDGKSETAVIGYKESGVVLAISVHSKTQQFQYIEFAISREKQDAVCVTPVKLYAVPLVCDQDSGELPGCTASSHTSGLIVDDKECDPINLYWDHRQSHMVWWRN